MGRIITAGIVGAIIHFVWGMAAWIVVPLHTPTINQLPAEREIVELMKAQDMESGTYVIPFMSGADDMKPDSEFTKNHEAGPIFSVYYRKEGSSPMPMTMMISGFLIYLLASTLAAFLLSTVGFTWGQSYWRRVAFVAGLGVFSTLVSDFGYWNWMYFPLDYTLAFVVDTIIGSVLAGLAIAFFIRPTEVATSASVAAKETTPTVAPAAPAKKTPAAPLRNDAINLLATLQREARFVDIVKEPLGDYSDAQVGAAARDVLRDCGTVIDRLFKIEPIVDQEEGSNVEIPDDADSSQFRVAGSGDAKSGALVHHGWQAKQCELPKWSGSKQAALIVSPAELEAK